jgi:hypothetical protein
MLLAERIVLPRYCLTSIAPAAFLSVWSLHIRASIGFLKCIPFSTSNANIHFGLKVISYNKRRVLTQKYAQRRTKAKDVKEEPTTQVIAAEGRGGWGEGR